MWESSLMVCLRPGGRKMWFDCRGLFILQCVSLKRKINRPELAEGLWKGKSNKKYQWSLIEDIIKFEKNSKKKKFGKNKKN